MSCDALIVGVNRYRLVNVGAANPGNGEGRVGEAAPSEHRCFIASSRDNGK